MRGTNGKMFSTLTLHCLYPTWRRPHAAYIRVHLTHLLQNIRCRFERLNSCHWYKSVELGLFTRNSTAPLPPKLTAPKMSKSVPIPFSEPPVSRFFCSRSNFPLSLCKVSLSALSSLLALSFPSQHHAYSLQWLMGIPSPYYNDSHKKWQRTCRAAFDNLMADAGEWERAGDVPGPSLHLHPTKSNNLQKTCTPNSPPPTS